MNDESGVMYVQLPGTYFASHAMRVTCTCACVPLVHLSCAVVGGAVRAPDVCVRPDHGRTVLGRC